MYPYNPVTIRHPDSPAGGEGSLKQRDYPDFVPTKSRILEPDLVGIGTTSQLSRDSSICLKQIGTNY